MSEEYKQSKCFHQTYTYTFIFDKKKSNQNKTEKKPLHFL